MPKSAFVPSPLGHGNSPGEVIAGREPYFGRPALFNHLAVGLIPVGKLGTVLLPMGYRGFITPVQQFWHRTPVRACHHERAHILVRLPGRQSPKRSIGIA